MALMSTSSLCFKEAYDARISGRLNLEDFLNYILAHYKGLRHQEDTEGKRPYISVSFEYEVRNLVLREDFEPLDDESKSIDTTL